MVFFFAYVHTTYRYQFGVGRQRILASSLGQTEPGWTIDGCLLCSHLSHLLLAPSVEEQLIYLKRWVTRSLRHKRAKPIANYLSLGTIVC